MRAGVQGEIYRAKHVKLGRDVAIKVLPSEFTSDAERLRRFEREARSASALNHPNIVTIYDIAEHEDTTYIAMELVEGRTLRELLQDGPLPVAKTIAIVTQICDGLGKAHAAGIVHRDLKPDNVMVTEDGLVKILDFGLAKPIARGTDSKLTTLTKATAQGVIVGTPHYMSPEQAASHPVDHRSDQFSFGVVLYELLCGQRPFEGSSVATVISAILRDTPSPARSLRPDVPKELERIVDPNRRRRRSLRTHVLEDNQGRIRDDRGRALSGGAPSGVDARPSRHAACWNGSGVRGHFRRSPPPEALFAYRPRLRRPRSEARVKARRSRRACEGSLDAGEHRGPMDGRLAMILPTDSAEDPKKGKEEETRSDVPVIPAPLSNFSARCFLFFSLRLCDFAPLRYAFLIFDRF